nr:hypothetical protein [Candidatus Sigynarchaeota archaeon]
MGLKKWHLFTRIALWGIIGLASLIIAFIVNHYLGGVTYLGIPLLAGLLIFLDYFACSIASAIVAPSIGKKRVTMRRVIVAAIIRAVVYITAFYWLLTAWFTGGQPLFNQADTGNIWGSINTYVLVAYILALVIMNAIIVILTFTMVH